jgi:phosphatidylglycerol:prolipoprotein diacylglycerol transferase
VPAGLAPARPREPASATAAAPARTAEAAPAPEAEQADWMAKAVEKVLTVTYWLDPGQDGEPFSATISFSGRRAGLAGKPGPGDTFAWEETVDGILPGSGPVAITAEVRGISPGDWAVTARPVPQPGSRAVRAYPLPDGEPAGARRVPWPRRVRITAGSRLTVRTAMLPFARVPGIFRFAYSGLIALGILAGLAVEGLLLSAAHLAVLDPTLLSAGAVAAGVAGGKAWFIALHRGRVRDGWCIQGFIAGAVAVVSAGALAGPGVPAGAFLAATATALLIGMAVGRPGCFWAGCCVGRPTAGWRGIWASDRRLGCRREPAQLLEALAALVIGLCMTGVILAEGLTRSGPAALGGLAAYTLIRQFILGLRAEPPRRWRYGRRVTIAAAAIALAVSVVLAVAG